jgi:foldase protein PrsA
MSPVHTTSSWGVPLVLLGLLHGCSTIRPNEGITVGRAWEEPPSPPAGARPHTAASGSEPKPASASSPGTGAVIAVVDGHDITRDRLIELLIRGHGVGVLEQIIVLEAAQREAATRGLKVGEAEVSAEYDGALRRLLSPLPAEEEGPLNREEGERVLERILSSRNISRAEYVLGMRRNAYLRKIVAHEMHFTEEQLKAEYGRAYGERVKVRHIQVATLAEAERVGKLLAADDADFAEVARRYSANPNTAAAGGVLRIFARDDEDVPALMRTTAFALEPGRISAPLRIGEWYHVLKVEERYPPERSAFAEVRAELEKQLRERLTEPAMQQLHQTLLQQAQVEILDPVLAEEYQRKHRQPTP